MPKEIKQYQCEVCGATYDTEEAANDCEHVHIHAVAVEKELYSLGCVYPGMLHVRMSNGALWVYKLGRQIQYGEGD